MTWLIFNYCDKAKWMMVTFGTEDRSETVCPWIADVDIFGVTLKGNGYTMPLCCKDVLDMEDEEKTSIWEKIKESVNLAGQHIVQPNNNYNPKPSLFGSDSGRCMAGRYGWNY